MKIVYFGDVAIFHFMVAPWSHVVKCTNKCKNHQTSHENRKVIQKQVPPISSK